MTPTQYRAALNRLGLTQAGAAKLFGVSLQTAQGYALGDYPVPKLVNDVLGLLMDGKISVHDLD